MMFKLLLPVIVHSLLTPTVAAHSLRLSRIGREERLHLESQTSLILTEERESLVQQTYPGHTFI